MSLNGGINMFNKTINRAKYKALRKLFKTKMNQIESFATNGQFEKFENHVVESVLEGEKRANNIIDNPERFDNEVVQDVLSSIEIDEIQHEESREFLKELEELERDEEKYKQFIQRFGDYYLDKLEENTNM